MLVHHPFCPVMPHGWRNALAVTCVVETRVPLRSAQDALHTASADIRHPAPAQPVPGDLPVRSLMSAKMSDRPFTTFDEAKKSSSASSTDLEDTCQNMLLWQRHSLHLQLEKPRAREHGHGSRHLAPKWSSPARKAAQHQAQRGTKTSLSPVLGLGFRVLPRFVSMVSVSCRVLSCLVP